MPSPTDALLRGFPSPVPTYTTFGSDGATAIAPMEPALCSSKIDVKVVPPLIVLMMPPLAPAT